MILKTISLTASLLLAAGIAGCRVHVDKDENGVEKNVQVDTPFGGVHVNTDQTSAADLGLPVYPGAQEFKTDQKHNSADVHLGFGEWQLRVRAVTYTSADPQDKVVAFYKKALTRYGDVITCQGHVAIGTPTRTSEGLTCEEDKNPNVQINGGKNGHYGTDFRKLELKAGSKRHQHIVGFDEPVGDRTRFGLVALDLPSFASGSDDKSD